MNKQWVLGISKAVGAGIAGGVTFIILTFVTFVLIGHGPLSDPGLQSPKVLAVLNELEPLPLFATKPHVIFLGYLLFSISHALLFRSVADAWPEGAAPRIWRLALVGWSLSYLFFEFLGPFNLLGEPLGLVALELCFWAAAGSSGPTRRSAGDPAPGCPYCTGIRGRGAAADMRRYRAL